MKRFIASFLLATFWSGSLIRVTAAVAPDTIANGTAYLTYDRAAWATLVQFAAYTDISGNPTGQSGPTADADGKRWMFPDRIEGTNWVAAAYPSAFLTPIPDYPLAQPLGGFTLPVNSYGTNRFATNHKITSYHSTTNGNGYIGLGGSLRASSDFNEPGASVWWLHLALRRDPADSIWKIYATSGAGQGSVFELRNVTEETVNGSLRLSGDYVFGNTEWLQFFQDVNGHLDTNQILGHIELIPAGYAKLFAGSATIHYSQPAWEALASGFGPTPVLTLSGFFNQAQANALSQSNLLNDPQSGFSYSNQVYTMNPSVVTNLPTRYTQPTTFLFPQGAPASHTGSIGLGGIARFAVYLGSFGNLIYGDYTLLHDTNRLAFGGTGWYLQGNIPPAAAAFDLLNVSVVETPVSLQISGNLGVSFEVANFLYNTPGDTLADVGTFNFTGYTAPLTTPRFGVSASGGSLALRGTDGLAGSSYSVAASTNLTLPASQWTTVATGTFDTTGRSSNSIPVSGTPGGRYYQIRQP